ncbi:hypothetical protein [Malonomonas rubra]|uniref:hypothetical protein n=1 Tax=Malonomonas rubra TaxID=57040 RepID=UPI0026E985A1|nr:hypothetical protein [Malonomonas rubra]
MKKIIQLLCSLLFATSIYCPADALVVPSEDPTDLNVEESLEVRSSEDYQVTLLEMDLGELSRRQSQHVPNQQMLFVCDSRGKVIKDAQVVTTLVLPNGRQLMTRAWPFVGGYLIPTSNLPAGQYRLEVEAATNGQFVTDEFIFWKA